MMRVFLPLLLSAGRLAPLVLLITVPHLAVAKPVAPPGSASSSPQCGHWAVFHSAEILGIPITMQYIQQKIPPAAHGHDMLALKHAIEGIGLHCKGYKETLEQMCARGFPAIVHLNPNHFFVIAAADVQMAIIFDGAGRRQLMRTEDFLEQWSGNALHVWREEKDLPLPRDTVRRSGPTPRIQMDTLFIDKGEVTTFGEPVEFSFPFRNLGSADLVITRAVTSCSCLKSTLPTKPIPPGEAGEIHLQYKASKAGGPFLYSSIVHTNDPVVPFLKLLTAGTTKRRAVIEPDTLDLGAVYAGQSLNTTIVVWSSGEQPFRVTKVGADVDDVKVRYGALNREKLRKKLALTQKDVRVFNGSQAMILSFQPAMHLTGQVDGKVYIYTTIDNFERIAVPFRMQVLPLVSLRPEVLFLDDIASGETFRHEIRFVAATNNSVKVDYIDAVGTGLTYKVTEDTTPWTSVVFSGKLDDPAKLSGKHVLIGVTMNDHTTQIIHLPIIVDHHRASESRGEGNRVLKD